MLRTMMLASALALGLAGKAGATTITFTSSGAFANISKVYQIRASGMFGGGSRLGERIELLLLKSGAGNPARSRLSRRLFLLCATVRMRRGRLESRLRPRLAAPRCLPDNLHNLGRRPLE